MKKLICKDRKGYDKLWHLILSFGLACILAGIFSLVPCGEWVAAIIVFILTIGVGVWKEISDKRKGGHICVWDLMADTLGAILGSIIAYWANYFTWCQ